MGNTSAAGHLLALAGPPAVGFERTLQHAILMNHIRPWSARQLLQQTLQRQITLAAVSPLRGIDVRRGLNHFRQFTGEWSTTLTREGFVACALELFDMIGLRIPLHEQMMLYDVFDSIDIYKTAALNIIELSSGLSVFFAGDFETRTTAIFDLLSNHSNFLASLGHCGSHIGHQEGWSSATMDALKCFLKPFIWCMIPEDAQVLWPTFVDYVSGEIFYDIACDTKFRAATCMSHVQMQRWMSAAQIQSRMGASAVSSPSTSGLQDHALHAIPSFLLMTKAALIIDIALQKVSDDLSLQQGLREYGQQTWAERHQGQLQRLTDVGARRYLSDSLPDLGHVTSHALQDFQGFQHRLADLLGDGDESDVIKRECAMSLPSAASWKQALPVEQQSGGGFMPSEFTRSGAPAHVLRTALYPLPPPPPRHPAGQSYTSPQVYAPRPPSPPRPSRSHTPSPSSGGLRTPTGRSRSKRVSFSPEVEVILLNSGNCGEQLLTPSCDPLAGVVCEHRMIDNTREGVLVASQTFTSQQVFGHAPAMLEPAPTCKVAEAAVRPPIIDGFFNIGMNMSLASQKNVTLGGC